MSFSKFYWRTFTVTSASPAVFTCTDHNLYPGDEVVLATTGALYTGLAADTAYYVIQNGLTSSTFELSASKTSTYDGTAINTSGSQSGTHTFLKTNRARFEPYQENDEDV